MKTIIIQTANGFALRFKCDEIRTSGRATQGVSVITMGDHDSIVDAIVVDNPDALILTVTENGCAKATPVKDYRITHRGGKGFISHKTSNFTGPVVSICEI